MAAPSPLRTALRNKYERPGDLIDETTGGPYQPEEPSPQSPQIYGQENHSQSPYLPSNGGGYAGGAQDWSQGPWDANRVRSFFQSKGVTPNASSPDYWAGKWNEWGQRDPGYFLQRLNAADELIGGPQNSPFQHAAASSSVNVPATSAFTDQIRQLLLAQIQQNQQPVTADDPNIKGQYDAAKLESERGLDTERKALAERLYASGDLNSGSLNQGIQQSAERQAMGLGSLRANLMARELTSRRDQLQQYLQMAAASGDAETARAIQIALANIDANLRQQGIDFNYSQLGSQMAQYAQNQNTNLFSGLI